MRARRLRGELGAAGNGAADRRAAVAAGPARLSAFGLLVKTDAARGGRRAYYRMPDRLGVEQALSELQDDRQ